MKRNINRLICLKGVMSQMFYNHIYSRSSFEVKLEFKRNVLLTSTISRVKSVCDCRAKLTAKGCCVGCIVLGERETCDGVNLSIDYRPPLCPYLRLFLTNFGTVRKQTTKPIALQNVNNVQCKTHNAQQPL